MVIRRAARFTLESWCPISNQQQTLTLSALPTLGTCDLKIGDTLLNGIIPANITGAGVSALLAAASVIFAAGVSEVYASLVDTFTFGSPVGNYDWPLIAVSANTLTAPDNTIGVATTTPYSAVAQASYHLNPSSATTGHYTVRGDPTAQDGAITDISISGGVDPTAVQAVYDAAFGAGVATVTSLDGTTPDLWLVVFNGISGERAFPGVGPRQTSNFTDSFPSVDTVVNGSFIAQIDTITLDSLVISGTWHISTQTGITYNDTGAGVQTAIETYLSISGGTIGNPSAGVWTYQYGTAGDQTAKTALLAANTAGDTLAKAVTVTPAITQHGSSGGGGGLAGSPLHSPLIAA